ncbi:twin-arginine translocase TatA/TatE family subunit [Thermodesulfobacteriota bacterium]
MIFGVKKFPDIGKGLGGALREFRKVKRELRDLDPGNNINKQGRGEGEDNPPSLENSLTKKVLDQVPGVKKAIDISEKVKKVKEVIK